MNTKLIEIFFVFLKMGALLLGGGYVILPLIQSELVEKRKWLDNEDLINYYAISQCLPGLIAANVSIFTGYKLRGKYGAICAILGLSTSPFITIVLIASALNKIMHLPIINSIFWGVGIGVIILIILSLKEMWSKSIVDKFSFFIFLLILYMTIFLKTSPIISILTAIIIGIIYKKILKGVKK